MRWDARGNGGWHRWYAWHPVRVGSAWVWREWVERQVHGGLGDSVPEYRELTK